MKNRNFSHLLLVLSMILSFGAISQTQTAVHPVNFSSGSQNMWGPSWNAITINQTISLFNESWNETFGTGNSGIVTIAGQSFGAAVNGQINGTVGMDFELSGFSTGTVSVDYPIVVTNTVTNDLTYDPGDNVTIATDYQVQGGANLTTMYPTVGTATLDFYFQMGFGLSATVCAFGCTTFPIIPNFNTGLINVNIFTIDQTGADFLTISAGPLAFGPAYSIPGLPVSTASIPGDPLGDWGLTGTLDLPYVTTNDNVNFATGDITACGGGVGPNPEYVNLTLSVFDLLGNLPAPVGPILGNLAGSQPLLGGLATINWNFFTAEVVVKIENKQCFYFTPRVYGQYQFPVPVQYSTTNPSGGPAGSGTSSIINCEIGGTITYRYPCYYTEIDIQPTYSIDGIFRNRTYDSVSVDLDMTALGFSLVIPPIEITPEINVPEICVPIPYPCPSWSCPWCWCTYTACTPAFTIPAIGYSGYTLSIGPLLDVSFPLFDFTYNWYDNTWSLEGFTPYTHPSFNFSMLSDETIDLSIVSQTNVSCFGGSNGSINTQMVQTPYDPATYNYVWSNGSTAADPAGLSAGTYGLILYDSHGCNHSTAVTITEPTKVEIADSTEDVSCNGNSNGYINITASGGTESGAYTYTWSTVTGSGIVPGAEDQTTLGAGTYDLIVTDDNGCFATATFVIDEPNPLGQVAAITDVDCKNNATGDIQVSSFGGTPQYTYSWNTGQTTEDLSNITAGTYTLTITDSEGCQSIVPYVVNEPANVLSLTVNNFVDVLCKGDATGSINIGTAGGNGGYSYDWSNASGILLPTQTEDLANALADTYTVTVTDSEGCQATISQVISEPLNYLSSTPTITDVLCFGASTGSVDPGIGGGTPAYTYAWSNATAAPILSGVPAGSYDLTVTDFNGCTATYSYTITQPAAPLGLTLTGTNILCFGESTGQVSTSVTGGTAPYTYLWTGGGQTTPIITGLPIGLYEVTVTDDNGCTIVDDITLTQPLAPLALSSVVTDVDCFGNNSGIVDLTITGGTGPYLKTWWNSATIILIDTTQDLTNQYADSYTVLVTDANGCTETLTSVVNEPAAPLQITGIIDHVNCFGLNDGAVNATVTGGTTPYTYSWSNAAITQDISGVLAGTYTLTVTDFNLCVATADFTITQPNAALVVTTITRDVLCNGGNDGEVLSAVSGGTAPYTYLWSNGATTPDIIGVVAGIYTVTITDAQGCTAFTGATVNEPTPLVANFIITDASCYGYADGMIEMVVSGGVPPYTFNWGNQNEILMNNPSEEFDGLTANDYFIRVEDDNGCKIEQILTVGQPNPFVSTTVISDALCDGSADGFVDVTITGGTTPYGSVWSDGQLTEDATGLIAGTYSYIVTDAQGCIINDTVEIMQPAPIEIIYEILPVSCIDQSDAEIFIDTYGGTSPYSYIWSTGATTQNAAGLPPGMYTVTISDANLCSEVFAFDIVINPDECLIIPNTITPNGDDYNDTWVLGNIDLYPNAVVKVFNKWGNEIYLSEMPYVEWDGTHFDKPLPSDVYYYIIILNNQEGNEYTGTITIIR